ncbi:MAG: metal-dependent hydrolase [Planctomycetota bacterium]|nr:metal-dependent hydrolase [Planctomycetota bacterium]
MDIVTHAVMGAIIATPFMDSHPVAAVCFAFGSVLPDLDAFSRLFGKSAFMKIHQTYSHALPVIALIGLLAWPALNALGVPALGALTLALGMMFHSLLDVTNTYGIALFLPFSKRRFSTEWVFFIDSIVIAISYPTLIILTQFQSLPGKTVLSCYCAIMLCYWLLKCALRRRALSFSPPGTVSLLPSALYPWEFLGCSQGKDEVLLFQVHSLTGNVTREESVPLFDREHEELTTQREFKIMSELSPAYHIVERDQKESGLWLRCKDLRTRNFKTNFGELEISLDLSGAVKDLVFHV